MQDSEIEDLIPSDMIVRELDRWQRSAEVPFADELKPGQPIVPQIEAWAARHKVELSKPGWKVELAKRVKQRLLAEGPQSVAPDVLDRWTKLFYCLPDREDRNGDEGSRERCLLMSQEYKGRLIDPRAFELKDGSGSPR
jgi:hypothetical protein